MGTNEATPNKSDMSEQLPEASDVGYGSIDFYLNKKCFICFDITWIIRPFHHDSVSFHL